MRSKMHVSTPSTNKLQRFIVPSECRGDEGEIPEIEYFKNERNLEKQEVRKKALDLSKKINYQFLYLCYEKNVKLK